jgi:hypothetical protein
MALLPLVLGGSFIFGCFFKYLWYYNNMVDMMKVIEDSDACVKYTKGKLRDFIAHIPENIRAMDLSEIRKKIKPTIIDYILRSSFWDELHKAIRDDSPMDSTQLFKDYCTDSFFYNRYVTNPHRLAWLLKPMPTPHQVKNALLTRTYERLWEILELDLRIYKDSKDTKGKISPGLCQTVLKVAGMIKDTVEGAPLQRIENKTMSMIVNRNSDQKDDLESLEEMEARIKQLKQSVGPIKLLEDDIAFKDEESKSR